MSDSDSNTTAAVTVPPFDPPIVDSEKVQALLEKARANSGPYAPVAPPKTDTAVRMGPVRRDLRNPARLLIVALGLGG